MTRPNERATLKEILKRFPDCVVLFSDKEEITKEARKEYKEALVRGVTAQWGDEFKKDLRSNLYVYFYYHGLSLLKPRGVVLFHLFQFVA